MNEIPIIKYLPEKYQGIAMIAVMAFPYVTRAWHALKSGGGLSGIKNAILFVTNTPTPPPPTAAGADNSGGKLGLLSLIAIAISGALLINMLLTGCGTTAQRIAFNSLYTVETGTKSAYVGYMEGVTDGSIATNDVPKVSAAFNHFQASFLVALDAVQYNTNALAPAALIVEGQDVVNLIIELKGKK